MCHLSSEATQRRAHRKCKSGGASRPGTSNFAVFRTSLEASISAAVIGRALLHRRAYLQHFGDCECEGIGQGMLGSAMVMLREGMYRVALSHIGLRYGSMRCRVAGSLS